MGALITEMSLWCQKEEVEGVICHLGDEEKIDFQKSNARGLTTYREEE
jgi:hypothetical protein